MKKAHEYLTAEAIEANIKKYLDDGRIYIPYNVVSSKNSKRIIPNKRTKRNIIIPSEQYVRYRTMATPYFLRMKKYFQELTMSLPRPLILGFYHIRFTRGAWDHHNMIQGPADIMQEVGWINDDDCYNVKIHPEGFHVDKLNQGLIITPYKSVTFER